jgi:hypothetical protein
MFLPGLPTVPFLLLTAWFSSKGSERLHNWLYSHPSIGKILRNWKEYRAISRKSKVLAVLMLIFSLAVIYKSYSNKVALLCFTILFAFIGFYLISRPEPNIN